jgi:hypothetical protein
MEAIHGEYAYRRSSSYVGIDSFAQLCFNAGEDISSLPEFGGENSLNKAKMFQENCSNT